MGRMDFVPAARNLVLKPVLERAAVHISRALVEGPGRQLRRAFFARLIENCALGAEAKSSRV